jgi:uncharacterized membrane protein
LYTVEAVAQEGELTTDNNRSFLLAPPPGRPRRVLLLEGAPGFEHSFLKRALERDIALQVDAVVRKGPNESGQQTYYVQADPARGRELTAGFPASRQALFAYDALILANLETDALTGDQLTAIADYVGERGGGLLVLGSRSLQAAAVSGTVLEELLPLEVSDRRSRGVARAELSPTLTGSVVLSADGERHPVMALGGPPADSRARWAKVPPLASVASVGAARPGATVLAYTAGPGGIPRPLIAVQRYGRGRVLAFAGEAAWRWRMMLPSTDTTYPTFWRQATRWVATATPEPLSVRAQASGSDRLAISVEVRNESFTAVRDARAQLEIRDAAGNVQTTEAAPVREPEGTYRAEVRVPAGVTRIDARATSSPATLGRATTWALAGPDSRELVEPRRNDAQLARLAERLGGRLIPGDAVAEAVREATARRGSAATLIEVELWHSAWVLMALLSLLGAEWMLRRRWGLR